MNDIIKFLKSHASVRQFTDKQISKEDECLILETAQQSPTSSNVQAYSIVAIRNKESKVKLSTLSGNQQHIIDSSLFLVFCADLYRLNWLCEERAYKSHCDSTESLIIATVDATLAASRALMAAQAIGIGGVMVGGIRNHTEEISKLLELPDLVYPVMGMSLGYPEKEPKIKPRLPLPAVKHDEKYSTTELKKAVEKYDRVIDDLGYLKDRKVEDDKYPDFDGIYSWSEHTARRMASDKPTTTRLHMDEYLKSKGFLKR